MAVLSRECNQRIGGFVDRCLRTVPTNSKVFFRGLLTMRKKQILTSVIESKKEIWGNHAFFNV